MCRVNRSLSFERSTEHTAPVIDCSNYPPVKTTVLDLNVTTSRAKKSKGNVTLDGISFSPMIGGIVVPVSSAGQSVKLQSFHVRVYRVEYGSKAYSYHVTNQMYVKSMSFVGDEGDIREFVMDTSGCRLVRTRLERGGDVFRGEKDIVVNNTIDLESLMDKVWSVLSESMVTKKKIRVEFVEYSRM